jgi:hypothetical protein
VDGAENAKDLGMSAASSYSVLLPGFDDAPAPCDLCDQADKPGVIKPPKEWNYVGLLCLECMAEVKDEERKKKKRHEEAIRAANRIKQAQKKRMLGTCPDCNQTIWAIHDVVKKVDLQRSAISVANQIIGEAAEKSRRDWEMSKQKVSEKYGDRERKRPEVTIASIISEYKRAWRNVRKLVPQYDALVASGELKAEGTV